MDFLSLETGINDVIGFNLYRARVRNRLKQREAADRLAISVAQLKKYEQGKETLRLDTASHACIRYGMSMDRLFANTIYARNQAEDEVRSSYVDRLGYLFAALEGPIFDHIIGVIAHTFHVSIALAPSQANPTDGSNLNCNDPATIQEYFKAISQGVKKLREANNWSQAAVADNVNISLSAYRGYEDESKVVRFNLLLAGRYAAVSKINPLVLVKDTQIGLARSQQDLRLGLIEDIVKAVDHEDLEFLETLSRSLIDHLYIKKKLQRNIH